VTHPNVNRWLPPSRPGEGQGPDAAAFMVCRVAASFLDGRPQGFWLPAFAGTALRGSPQIALAPSCWNPRSLPPFGRCWRSSVSKVTQNPAVPSRPGESRDPDAAAFMLCRVAATFFNGRRQGFWVLAFAGTTLRGLPGSRLCPHAEIRHSSPYQVAAGDVAGAPSSTNSPSLMT